MFHTLSFVATVHILSVADASILGRDPADEITMDLRKAQTSKAVAEGALLAAETNKILTEEAREHLFERGVSIEIITQLTQFT